MNTEALESFDLVDDICDSESKGTRYMHGLKE
jgi:hypothetical protein